MKPVRLQLSRRKGFRLAQVSRETNGLDAVNVARPHAWGNPYRVGPSFTAADAVEAFRDNLQMALAVRQVTRDMLAELRGKNLACWCRPGEPCHADVLLELANR